MASFTDDIIVKLGLNNTRFAKAMRESQGMVAKFSSAAKGMFAVFGVGVGGGALVSLGRKVLDFADNLQTASDTIGQTTKFLQEFRFAANQSGIDTKTADMALQRFTRRLAEARNGSGELRKVIEQYGIALKDSSGRTRGARDVLRDLADVLKKTKDPAERLRISFKAFDSEGAKMVALLKEGSEAFDNFGESAKGAVISQENVNVLNAFNNELKKLSAWLLGFSANKFAEVALAILQIKRGLQSARETEGGFVLKSFAFVAGMASVSIELQKKLKLQEEINQLATKEGSIQNKTLEIERKRIETKTALKDDSSEFGSISEEPQQTIADGRR